MVISGYATTIASCQWGTMENIEQPFVLEDIAFNQAFLTASSISFAAPNVGRGAEVGWVDIHWPCEGDVGAIFRGSLPRKRLIPGYLNALVGELSTRLGIPKEVPKEVLFFKADHCITFRQSGLLNDDETTDRIETTRSFRLP
ncbi:MAG: hypothetical protein U1E05_01780 [Patescibacteria group bacterium]|nr:hypothetical protein [Patescibacteria group bacterium]